MPPSSCWGTQLPLCEWVLLGTKYGWVGDTLTDPPTPSQPIRRGTVTLITEPKIIPEILDHLHNLPCHSYDRVGAAFQANLLSHYVRPFASLRLRTDAAKRFKKVDNATTVIFKLLLVAEKNFRRLNAPELMKKVYLGVRFEDGERISESKVAAA